jgi:hypothetical protein
MPLAVKRLLEPRAMHAPRSSPRVRSGALARRALTWASLLLLLAAGEALAWPPRCFRSSSRIRV